MRRRLATVLVILVLGALAAACGDDDVTPTSITSGGIIFGEGEVPPAFPSDFPMPANAVIGSTLIDPINHRSEMNIRLGVEMTAMVQFYNVGLVNQGYVVTGSTGSSTSWEITFTRDTLAGSIVFSPLGEITQAVATVNAA